MLQHRLHSQDLGRFAKEGPPACADDAVEDVADHGIAGAPAGNVAVTALHAHGQRAVEAAFVGDDRGEITGQITNAGINVFSIFHLRHNFR